MARLPRSRLPAASHLRVAAHAVPEYATGAPPSLAQKRSGSQDLSATRAQTAQRGAKWGEVMGLLFVITGLVPVILLRRALSVPKRDGRDRPGHDKKTAETSYTRPLPGPHHFFRLRPDAGDAFDLERRAAGFLRDFAVLLDDEAERGRVLLQAAQQFGRHAPVGALRAVLIDDVEEHEFAFGIGSRFLGHGRCPVRSVVIPGRPEGANAAPRNDELNESHSNTKKKNPAQARGFSSRLVSDRLQIGSGRLAVLAIGFDVERELLALVEIAHAGALDCRDVNEHIRPAAALHDEAEALLGVEELNGTCGHGGLLLKTLKGVNAPCKPFAWASYPDSACSWGRPSSGRNCKAGEIGTMSI